MKVALVPNYISEAIYKKIDAQLVLHPDLIGDREIMFSQLLEHFDTTGVVADFTIERKEPSK